jgi:sialic acid synthase SpsE
VLEADLLTTKRPGDGISALRLSEIVGRRAARALEADHKLEEADVG